MSERQPVSAALYAFFYALRSLDIDTESVEVSMPPKDWQRLSRDLCDELQSSMIFEARPQEPNRFRFAGITFSPRYRPRP